MNEWSRTTTLCVLKQQYQHFVDRMGMRVEAGMVSALFHKSLALTTAAQLKCDGDEIFMLVKTVKATATALKHVHLCWATPLSAGKGATSATFPIIMRWFPIHIA